MFRCTRSLEMTMMGLMLGMRRSARMGRIRSVTRSVRHLVARYLIGRHSGDEVNPLIIILLQGRRVGLHLLCTTFTPLHHFLGPLQGLRDNLRHLRHDGDPCPVQGVPPRLRSPRHRHLYSLAPAARPPSVLG